jgi:hypothetical protein
MRKFFNIFLFVLCTIAIAGCNDTESSESRLEIKAVNTNEVVFEVKENTGYSGRNALLTISNGVETEAFNINQSGAVFIFG